MPHDTIDIWAVEGRFQHLVYSPKGGIEGLLIDTDGVPTQFVTDPHDASVTEQLSGLRPGQSVQVEGSEAGPSHKGEPAHTVYHFQRLASIDGRPAAGTPAKHMSRGTVVRLNYARHGAPNGLVLDNGDFIHTRPEGFERLGLGVGDLVSAEGDAHSLAVGSGRVIEARQVNGKPLG